MMNYNTVSNDPRNTAPRRGQKRSAVIRIFIYADAPDVKVKILDSARDNTGSDSDFLRTDGVEHEDEELRSALSSRVDIGPHSYAGSDEEYFVHRVKSDGPHSYAGSASDDEEYEEEEEDYDDDDDDDDDDYDDDDDFRIHFVESTGPHSYADSASDEEDYDDDDDDEDDDDFRINFVESTGPHSYAGLEDE